MKSPGNGGDIAVDRIDAVRAAVLQDRLFAGELPDHDLHFVFAELGGGMPSAEMLSGVFLGKVVVEKPLLL